MAAQGSYSRIQHPLVAMCWALSPPFCGMTIPLESIIGGQKTNCNDTNIILLSDKLFLSEMDIVVFIRFTFFEHIYVEKESNTIRDMK